MHLKMSIWSSDQKLNMEMYELNSMDILNNLSQ